MSVIPQGAIRLNTDSQKLEFYAQDQWWEMATDVSNVGGNGGPAADPTGNSADQASGHRGLIMGGSSYTDTIEYITIPTTGNGIDFGNLDTGTMLTTGCSSNTRGLSMGGRKSPGVQENRIEYVTIQSTGDGTNFGDLTKTTDYANIGNLGNATRGLLQGGHNPAHGDADMGVDINYVTIASTGDAVKFGECSITHLYSPGTFSSPTRGVIAGGGNPGINTTEFITIASTGNAVNFGELLGNGGQGSAGASSSVVGLVAGGYYGGSDHFNVEKFTIATTGNSIDWGDLTDSRRWLCPLSDSIRAVWCGGYAPGSVDTMDYNVFATGGAAVDFGNMTVSPASRGGQAGASSGHGGL